MVDIVRDRICVRLIFSKMCIKQRVQNGSQQEAIFIADGVGL